MDAYVVLSLADPETNLALTPSRLVGLVAGFTRDPSYGKDSVPRSVQ